MMPPPPPPSNPFQDVHLVEHYNESRLEALRGDAPIGRNGEAVDPTRDQRDAIVAFLRAKKGEVGALHLRNYLSWLPVAASRMGKSFLEPGPDVQGEFNDAFPTKSKGEERTFSKNGYANGYSYFSRQTAANCLGVFWRWHFERRGEDLPNRCRLKYGTWKSPFVAKDMLTRDDVQKLVDAVDTARDRAWLWTCFSSGCRPGEIYQLRVGDVVPHNGWVELHVHREKDSDNTSAFIYEDGVPALLTWLKTHPEAGNPKAPLWVALREPERGHAASYRAMVKIVDKASARANLGKPVTLYHLRRSRLTELAKDPAINQSVLEKIAGWTQGSRVSKHYIHLDSSDVRRALGSRYGVAEPAPTTREPSRTPKRCGRCSTVNQADSNFCSTCGGPLSLPAVEELRGVESSQRELAELLSRPEIRDFLVAHLANARATPSVKRARAHRGETRR
ncbi:MAG: site-specific integrase [Thermoplasmata archaeon]